ncbi:hypothetical protein [Pseudonocardia xishanensis]|uniref:Uncharacterized protein n=1 Tax=Pseudonocardia xishanensis TaxID=630995 RepID=A0ABP8RS83_9PSEU
MITTTYPPQRRRPTELPADIAEALAKHDELFAKAVLADSTARNLADQSADAMAERADREAAAKAATEGKPIPAATAVPKLAADREKANREAAAYAAALAEAAGAVDELRIAHQHALEATEDENRKAAAAVITTKATEAVTSIREAVAAELTRRSTFEWVRTAGMPALDEPTIHPAEVVPGIVPLGIGTVGQHAHMRDVPTEIVARALAALAEKIGS